MDNDKIRARAHEIWESEGCPDGRDADHWTRAEAELKQQMGAEPAGDPQPELAQTEPVAKPKRARKPAKAKVTEGA